MVNSKHLTNEQKEILKAFQTDRNREVEEQFVQAFAENDKTRLFFINENQAFTDGRNIVVDPAVDELFIDRPALEATEKLLEWPDEVVSNNPWNALKIITRAQVLHEGLHLLYTDFPNPCLNDARCSTKNKKIAMSLIANIIEDAYIEAVGASVYDNIGHYLKFGRVSRVFAANGGNGTVTESFSIEISVEGGHYSIEDEHHVEKERPKKVLNPKVKTLAAFLDYNAVMLLYPFIQQEEPPEEIKDYAEKTRQLFLDGSIASSPDERSKFSQKIFDVILPLIPEDDEVPDLGSAMEELYKRISGTQTHSPDSNSIGGQNRKGRTQEVTERLFTTLAGKKKETDNGVAKLVSDLKGFDIDKDTCIRLIAGKGFKVEHTAQSVGATAVHKNIKIIENHPEINLNLRKAYQNIYNRYHVNINSYNSRFNQLLRAKVPVRENKFQFGAGIESRMLGDVKRRYWFRNQTGIEIPDMSILLLIDGSGSMNGNRCMSAMISSLILHEVLKKQGIEHCVAEHRTACNGTIDVNILLDFGAKEEEKLNLMQLGAGGGNRDGLALYWAEKYINRKTYCVNKLIIIISDGYPNDPYDDYCPPVSTKDTANAVKKIIIRGTDVIGVSLDDSDEYSTYDNLKEIYPNLVACNNLKRLTGQILNIISRQLR